MKKMYFWKDPPWWPLAVWGSLQCPSVWRTECRVRWRCISSRHCCHQWQSYILPSCSPPCRLGCADAVGRVAPSWHSSPRRLPSHGNCTLEWSEMTCSPHSSWHPGLSLPNDPRTRSGSGWHTLLAAPLFAQTAWAHRWLLLCSFLLKITSLNVDKCGWSEMQVKMYFKN